MSGKDRVLTVVHVFQVCWQCTSTRRCRCAPYRAAVLLVIRAVVFVWFVPGPSLRTALEAHALACSLNSLLMQFALV